MATISDSSVSFEETDTRSDEMHSTIEGWVDDLVAGRAPERDPTIRTRPTLQSSPAAGIFK